MSDWNKIYYRYEKDSSEEIEVSKGVSYYEKPSFFKKAPKKVIIVFKDDNKKSKKRK